MTDYKDRVSGWPTDIDWSKAPEGATHYQRDDGGHWLASWIKKGESDVLMAMLDDGEDTKWGPGGLFSKKKGFLIPRPAPQWNGEGLPPVGGSVEFMWNYIRGGSEYVQVRVLAHNGQSAILRVVEGDNSGELRESYGGECGGHPIFRPIKTKAQIAADEREAAIQAIEQATGLRARDGSRAVALSIYEAGYRLTK